MSRLPNLYKHCPSPIFGVRGLGFIFGKIGGSEEIVLETLDPRTIIKSFVHRDWSRG